MTPRPILLALALGLAVGPGSRARAQVGGDLPPLETAEPTRVGLYPLERVGAADPAYDKLQRQLLASLNTFPHTEAIDLATPRRCRADELTCLVTVGRLAAVDNVVHGSIERFGDGFAVRLQLIDVGRTTRREAKRLIQGGGPELGSAMESAACELMTTEKCVGTLKVDGVPGARVRIAAMDVGETPWTGQVAVGRHVIRVARGALSTEDRFVTVSFHQPTTLAVVERAGMLSYADEAFDPALLPPDLLPPDLDKAPPLPPPSALVAPTAPIEGRPASATWLPGAFKASLAVSGLALLTGVGFGVAASSAASEANSRFDARTLRAVDRELYDAATTRAGWANTAYGVSAAGLVAAGVFFLLDPGVLDGSAR